MRGSKIDVAQKGLIVTPSDATDCPDERRLMGTLILDARAAGVKLFAVKWDDGVVALVPGDPADATNWKKALIKTHRAAAQGVIGPVNIGADK